MVTRKCFLVTFIGLRTLPVLFTLTPDNDATSQNMQRFVKTNVVFVMKHICVDWISLASWKVTAFITAVAISFFFWGGGMGREAVKFGVQYIHKILIHHIQGRT